MMEPEDTIVENENGGRQSRIDERFDLIPQNALRLIALCVARGAKKYGVDNWKKISSRDHVSHAMRHISLHVSGDKSEEHLVNATTRLLFALEMEKGKRKRRPKMGNFDTIIAKI